MKNTVSKALREVREWKDACWQEVAHLPLDQALAKRLRDATATTRRLGLLAVEDMTPAHRVAEARGEYKTRSRRRV